MDMDGVTPITATAAVLITDTAMAAVPTTAGNRSDQWPALSKNRIEHRLLRPGASDRDGLLGRSRRMGSAHMASRHPAAELFKVQR